MNEEQPQIQHLCVPAPLPGHTAVLDSHPAATTQGSRGGCPHIPAGILIQLYKLCSTSSPE